MDRHPCRNTFVADTRQPPGVVRQSLGRGEDGGLCIGYIENAMHPVCFLRRYVRYVYRVRMCISTLQPTTGDPD